jgi:hypothetical protein
MNTVVKKGLVYVLGVVVLLMAGCGPSIKKSITQGTLHTKYNFHYTMEKGKIRGSIANYTKIPEHAVLPYGSQVTVKSGGRGYILTDVKSGRQIDVLVKPKYLAGKSLSEYLELILSKDSVTYTGLSDIDQKGINEGVPYKGMTKQGVMIALGYPCPIKTPSPEANVWNYWKNRFDYYPVTFENGIVISSGY